VSKATVQVNKATLEIYRRMEMYIDAVKATNGLYMMQRLELDLIYIFILKKKQAEIDLEIAKVDLEAATAKYQLEEDIANKKGAAVYQQDKAIIKDTIDKFEMLSKE